MANAVSTAFEGRGTSEKTKTCAQFFAVTGRFRFSLLHNIISGTSVKSRDETYRRRRTAWRDYRMKRNIVRQQIGPALEENAVFGVVDANETEGA